MYEQVEKSKENTASAGRRRCRSVTNSTAQKKSNVTQGFGFVDNRLETVKRRNLQSLVADGPRRKRTDKNVARNANAGLNLQSNHSAISITNATQLFPKERQIAIAGGQFLQDVELLTLIQQVTNAELQPAAIAARPPTDWFRHFASDTAEPNGAPYGAPPAAANGLDYNFTAVRETLNLGDERVVRIGQNNYMYPEGGQANVRAAEGVPAVTHTYTSYPELYTALTDHAANPLNEVARAARMRALIAAGPNVTPAPVGAPAFAAPTQTTHEATTTAALFGSETARAPRTFLSHMMNLDRLESQQPYGRVAPQKNLTLRKLLDTPKPAGTSGNQFWQGKSASLEGRTAGMGGRIVEGNNATVTGIANRTARHPVSNNLLAGSSQVHGGKAPMAGGGTRAMGKAPVPAAGAPTLNIVHAKEVNTLIKWLDLQVGINSFAGLNRAEATARITGLLQERVRNYYLMNQGENNDRVRIIRIQALIRGRKARKDLRQARLESAAPKLQALVRGKNARKEFLQTKEATTKMQALVRGKNARREFQKQIEAVKKLQSLARGIAARKEADLRRAEINILAEGWAETLSSIYGWSNSYTSEFARGDEAREHALMVYRNRDKPIPSYII